MIIFKSKFFSNISHDVKFNLLFSLAPAFTRQDQVPLLGFPVCVSVLCVFWGSGGGNPSQMQTSRSPKTIPLVILVTQNILKRNFIMPNGLHDGIQVTTQLGIVF